MNSIIYQVTFCFNLQKTPTFYWFYRWQLCTQSNSGYGWWAR